MSKYIDANKLDIVHRDIINNNRLTDVKISQIMVQVYYVRPNGNR